MTEKTGFIGQIRRLSRRLSGTLLSANARDVKAYYNRNDNRKDIFTFDNEDQMKVGGIVLKELAEEYGMLLYAFELDTIFNNQTETHVHRYTFIRLRCQSID